MYPAYVHKAKRKGRTKEDVDEIIRWLTGYSQKDLEVIVQNQTDFETLFDQAPALNPKRFLISGVICGVRIVEIAEPLMKEIRFLDTLIDDLAKGKAMENILRK